MERGKGKLSKSLYIVGKGVLYRPSTTPPPTHTHTHIQTQAHTDTYTLLFYLMIIWIYTCCALVS